ncbi:MAG TPA: Hcp family type VI secretion system effector [Herbaspirillum sp.]|jgi:type VI secretion system secreted protein Hcp|nr:Hcp family type VI secretion system effector [Herbaspirillum sp.]
MPKPCYLTLKGPTVGDIKGSNNITGHEEEIPVRAIEHTIEIPRNPQTGTPTGQRIHLPITLTKEIDKASPLLFQALTTGEEMEHVTLAYYRGSGKGKDEKYYTVVLGNAVITSIRTWMPDRELDANKTMGHMEDVSFAYSSIKWCYEKGGITTEDKWMTA